MAWRLAAPVMLALALLDVAAPPAPGAEPLPADCPQVPIDGQTISLEPFINIGRGAGAPAGGFVGLGLDNVPADGTICTPAQPALPADILRGDRPASGNLLNDTAGSVLRGDASHDILSGN